jgi:hypothetical protein
LREYAIQLILHVIDLRFDAVCLLGLEGTPLMQDVVELEDPEEKLI